MAGVKSYPLAAMSGLFRSITWFVLPIPLLLAVVALVTGITPLWIVVGSIGVVFAIVWLLMRPKSFDLGPRSLEVVFPTRSLAFERASFTSVETLSFDDLRRKYGLGYRIGAGGLFGAFGLYKTRGTTFQFYVSRMSDLVVIHRVDDRPLMITPSDHEGFAAALGLAPTD